MVERAQGVRRMPSDTEFEDVFRMCDWHEFG